MATNSIINLRMKKATTMAKSNADKKRTKNNKLHKKSLAKSQFLKYATIAIVCTILGATTSVIAIKMIDSGGNNKNEERTQLISSGDNPRPDGDMKDEQESTSGDMPSNNSESDASNSGDQRTQANTKEPQSQSQPTNQQSPQKQDTAQPVQPSQPTKPTTSYPSSGTFGYGGKFEIRGVHYQVGSTTSFHTIHARYSDYDGKTAFCIPLTLTNTTSELKTANYSGWKSYRPNGESINPYANDLLSNEIKTYSYDILPGNSVSKYYCTFYYGSGNYTIAIPGNSPSVLDVIVKINVSQ